MSAGIGGWGAGGELVHGGPGEDDRLAHHYCMQAAGAASEMAHGAGAFGAAV